MRMKRMKIRQNENFRINQKGRTLKLSESLSLQKASSSNCQTSVRRRERERKPKPQTGFFFVSSFSLSLFYAKKKKKKIGNINVEPCHQSDCYQNSFFVGLHAQTLSRFVFLQYDKQKYNTKKACVLPQG